MVLLNRFFVTLLLCINHCNCSTGSILGKAEDWQIGFQAPATDVMEQVIGLHNMVFYIITAISIFVLILLFYVMVRFNARANPVPAKWTHNHLLEAVWIIVPLVLVLIMLIPNIKLMYLMDKNDTPDTTVKIIGNQWFWSYEYPPHELDFESRMVPLNKIDKKKGNIRLLSVDNPLVVQAGARLRMLITSNDVLHAATIPSWGFKVDAVPGKFNIVSLTINKKGVYYGQCSELCGALHAYMPLMICVVEPNEYKKFMKRLSKEKSNLITGKTTTLKILEDLKIIKKERYKGKIALTEGATIINDEALGKILKPKAMGNKLKKIASINDTITKNHDSVTTANIDEAVQTNDVASGKVA